MDKVWIAFWRDYLFHRWVEKYISTDLIALLLFFSMLVGPGLQFSKIYLFHLVFCTFLILSSRKITHSLNEVNKPILFFLSYTCLLGFSVFWSDAKGLGVKNFGITLIGFLSTTVIYLSIVKRQVLYRKAMTVATGVLVVQVVLGLLEVFTDFRYPISKLSKINSSFGISYLENEFSLDMAHIASLPTGFSWSPNSYASFLVLFFPLGLLFLRKLYWKSILVFTVSYLIYVGQSKAAILGLCFTLVSIAIFEICQNKSRTMKSGITVLLTLISVFVVYGIRDTPLLIDIKKTATGIERAWNEGDSGLRSHLSLPKRITRLKEGLSRFDKSPIFGAGAGMASQHTVEGKTVYENLHFYFLEPLIETGVIGFFLFLVPILFILFASLKNVLCLSDLRQKRISFYFSVALVSFSLSSFGMSSLIYYLPWYLFLGLILVHMEYAKNYPRVDIL